MNAPKITLTIEEIVDAFLGRLEAVSPHVATEPQHFWTTLDEKGLHITFAPARLVEFVPTGKV